MSGAIRPHLWKGQWLSELELDEKLQTLGEELARRGSERLALETLLDACADLSEALQKDEALRAKLITELHEVAQLSKAEILASIEELAAFCARDNLQEKIARELASGEPRHSPFRLERTSFRGATASQPFDAVYEAWAPLGFLVHIAPTNAINVPFLSVLEGLLCGNICFLKTGGRDSLYAQLCLEALGAFDPSGDVAAHIFAARISSSRKDLLKKVLVEADGVAVWGSEEAVESIRALTPTHARLIAWGPKISFAYFERTRLEDGKAIEALAREVCALEQQACSSPQVVYVETEEREELEAFARRLSRALEGVSPRFPRQTPSTHEQAEITQTVLITRLESALEEETPLRVLEGEGWRVLLDGKPGLRASPLYRTIWVKALSRQRITATLRPLRHYLQTVGLECPPESLHKLSRAFFAAGALRITRVGAMVSGYTGEPHDGVYALQRYARRVSVMDPELPQGISSIDELAPASLGLSALTSLQGLPLLTKTDLQKQKIDPRDAQFFVKSGGSSGEPQLSVFTYDDYHIQMKLAAHGLVAAGLDPARDRVMNLFFGGGLYGGFISFFSILEEIKATQFPMAASADPDFIVRIIAEQGVDTLLGMPSYIWNLFQNHDAFFSRHRGVKKIFYGGEHFSESQRRLLKDRYGVEVIRSATYGSNDSGPMGYQCQHCEGTAHHLHDRLQTLEILKTDRDEPVAPGEVGRLVLSSRVRRGQNLKRYEIGDLGRWVEGPCRCGRQSPRFELLGRYGDVFRVGGIFLNVTTFTRLLDSIPDYAGEFQLRIDENDELTLLFTNPTSLDPDMIRTACLTEYADLSEIIETDKTATFRVRHVGTEGLEHVPGSGKLRKLIDRRKI
jgi:phenylacetate-coenzyme A ligase PaaK-like adenylate-forming protein